jgi:hypothetical protein
LPIPSTLAELRKQNATKVMTSRGGLEVFLCDDHASVVYNDAVKENGVTLTDLIDQPKPAKAVYTIVTKDTRVNTFSSASRLKQIYVRIGWAKVNDDGSMDLDLDALPVNGKLHVRDWAPDATIPVVPTPEDE